MEHKMKCNQCEETFKNDACTVQGICGKDFILANKMDVLKEYLKVLATQCYNAKQDNIEDKRFIMHSMFKLITNANFNKDTIEKQIEYVKKMTGKKELEPYYEQEADLNAVKSLIMGGLMGICAYHAHATKLGFEDQEIHDFVIASLATINEIKDLNELVALNDETGKFGVKVMDLLDRANNGSFGHPEITKVNIGVAKRPGILISGHDLHDMKQLLEQSKDSGVDVYTHSEMLPAHYYPEFKKYKHLVGNYGNAWWAQREEFESFHGPILFTTNCIVPPKANAGYLDRLYSTGDCDHPGFIRIETDENGDKDFSALIAHAKECKAPSGFEQGEIVGGFAHSQILSLAETIIENIKDGSIRKFIVMSGCDGRKKERNYYTEFAKGLSKDTIILTSGCAKYRYNKLKLGDINGIPRVLDAGQCNDSYSLVVVALKLKEIFELHDINDLPISYNIAWYEQKAIIVLLSLLHLGVKNIKVGPTLPGYLTKNVVNFLVDTYGISTTNSVEEDLSMLG